VRICDTFITLSRGRPLIFFDNRTFPGALDSLTFDVITTITMVLILLRLNVSDWTIRAGRRPPGPEPIGSTSDAHQISPRFNLPFLWFEHVLLSPPPAGIKFRAFVRIDFVESANDLFLAIISH
jgi:hypothetical protein